MKLAAVLGMFFLGGCTAAAEEFTLVKACQAVDLGERLILTARHCHNVLPSDAVIVFDAGGQSTTVRDFLIARDPDRDDRARLPCRSKARAALVWKDRRTRLVGTEFPGLYRLEGVQAQPGDSGSPVTTVEGSLVTIVVARDVEDHAAYVVAPSVICTAVEYARALVENMR